MSKESPDNEAYVQELRARQRNTVFPDTVRNGRSVDLLLWRGNPDAPLVQRIGIGLFALTFLGLSFALFAIAVDQGDGDMWAPMVLGSLSLFVGFRLGINAFRRNRNRNE